MAASPPRNRRDGLASVEVHRRLRHQILTGELPAGDPVPSERFLSESLGVNRHAVREALKRLQQAGLVQISQGGATRVLDWRHNAGLDLLLDLMGQGDAPPDDLVRSVLEMRASIGIDVARRCAERGDTKQRNGVAAAAEATAVLAEGDDEEVVDSFVTLWQLIVDGSGNLAYQLALNSLNAALTANPELAYSLTSRDPEALRALGSAIAGRRSSEAADVARSMLEADLGSTG